MGTVVSISQSNVDFLVELISDCLLVLISLHLTAYATI